MVVLSSKGRQDTFAVLIVLIALLICSFLITFLVLRTSMASTNVKSTSNVDNSGYSRGIVAIDANADPYLNENLYNLQYVANRENKNSRKSENHSIDLSNGLVLYLPFDESSNSNVFLDSKNGHDAFCSGTQCPVTGVTGHKGGAVRFDGVNDLVEIHSSSALSFGKEFSVSIWYEGTKNQAGQFLIGRWNGVDGISWIMSFATGGIYNGTDFYVSEDGTAGNNAHRVYRRTKNLNMDGNWHNLVAVFKANQRIELYVDGNMVGEVVGDISLIDNVFDSSQSIRIGSGFGNFAQMQTFEGSVDELRIWNRALSSSEVQKVRNL